jgi:membrane-bound lytic murein transglycosylase
MLREPTIEKLHAMRPPVMALATGGAVHGNVRGRGYYQ